MLRIGMLAIVLVSMFTFGNTVFAQDQFRDRDRQYATDPAYDRITDQDRDRTRDRDSIKAMDLQMKGGGDRDMTRDQTRDRDRIHNPAGSATRQGGRR